MLYSASHLVRARRMVLLSLCSRIARCVPTRKGSRSPFVAVHLRLRRRVDNGDVELRDLADWEQENLTLLENGTMLCRTNHAVAAYGHGTLRHDDESIEIGGSTGGVSRLLLDNYAEPNVYSFLSRR